MILNFWMASSIFHFWLYFPSEVSLLQKWKQEAEVESVDSAADEYLCVLVFPSSCRVFREIRKIETSKQIFEIGSGIFSYINGGECC